MMFAEEGIFLLSGAAYEGAIIPMQIIMPTILWIGLTNIMGMQMLVPMGKEKIVLYSEIAGAIVDLVINFALIPSMASIGAAIGTLVAEMVVWIVQFWSLKKIVFASYSRIHYGKIVVAVIFSVVGSVWIKKLLCGTFVTLLVSGILFFGLYLLVLTMERETLIIEIENQVLDIIKKKRNK